MSAIETDLLKPELVFFDFEATDRIDFFTKLGEKLKEGGYVKDSWLDAILEREKNYPTGLECTSISVALPHVDADTYARRLFAFLGFDVPTGYLAFHKAYSPVVLDASLSVKDLQEFHGLIDEFGKAYRDDAAKSESFLGGWRA